MGRQTGWKVISTSSIHTLRFFYNCLFCSRYVRMESETPFDEHTSWRMSRVLFRYTKQWGKISTFLPSVKRVPSVIFDRFVPKLGLRQSKVSNLKDWYTCLQCYFSERVRFTAQSPPIFFDCLIFATAFVDISKSPFPTVLTLLFRRTTIQVT